MSSLDLQAVRGDVWEQLPDEPDHWFDRFNKFAKTLGPEFTVRRAYRLYKRDNPGPEDGYDLWTEMSERWQWGERAREWSLEDRSDMTRLWEQRRRQLLDADWNTGARLRGVASDYLELLQKHKEVARVIDPETGIETVTLAVNITAGDLTRLLKIASELQRLGVGEPTTIQGTAQPGVGIYLPKEGE